MTNRLTATLAGCAVAAIFFAVSSQTAVAAPEVVITPDSVSATSTWPGLSADDLINGNGLDINSLAGTHGNDGSAAHMWHAVGSGTSPAVVADQVLTFDLGALYHLTQTHIWNHNQVGLTGRGVASMDIYGSADGSTYSFIGNVTPAEALGTTAEGVQNFATASTTPGGIQFIQFRLVDSFNTAPPSGSTTDYVGLSEVRFSGTVVPTPSAVLGSAALLGVLGVRRRRRSA